MHSYVVEYLNENEFKKKEKSLKKYNMIAFKKLIFDCVPSLRDGTFPGEIVLKNSTENFIKYEYKLPYHFGHQLYHLLHFYFRLNLRVQSLLTYYHQLSI